MSRIPAEIATFLASHHVAVAGVSRSGSGPGALIAKRLRDSGHAVWLVNPAANEIGGVPCYPSLSSVPGDVGSVMVVTAPADSVKVVEEAIARGVHAVWLHRSFGEGSVSPAAVERCRAAGVTVVEGGCPMVYLPPVDIAHRVFRFWLELQGRVPR